MRRRAIGLSAALCLLGGGVVSAEAAPQAGPTARRTVTVAYDGPAAYYAACVDCPQVRARAGERYVTVEVVDAASPSGHVDVAWELEEGPGHGYVVVCGRTAKPQPIPAKALLTVFPWAHPGPECPSSISTRGTVRLTFSSRP